MPPDNTALRGRSFERIRVYVINSAVLVSGMLRGGQRGGVKAMGNEVSTRLRGW